MTVNELDTENAALRRKIMGYITSQAIFAMSTLGLADLLGDEPAAAVDLAAAAGADADALQRFLRVLAAEGLFVESPPGTFALTPMGGLLRSDVPGSLRHFCSLMAGEAYTAWSGAAHSLRTGGPAFDAVFGQPYFEWLAEHPAASARFDRAQAGLVVLRLRPLLNRDWTGVRTVVDVGAGNGQLLTSLLAEWTHLRGVLFDLPHVVAGAAHVLREAGLAARCRCVGGDFFRDMPTGGDVYVLAQILHDWDDDHAVAILRQCRGAMDADGRLLILEHVVHEDGQPHPAKMLDLHMLVMLGGRERTETAWRELLARGGFAAVDISHSARSSLIEARPDRTDMELV